MAYLGTGVEIINKSVNKCTYINILASKANFEFEEKQKSVCFEVRKKQLSAMYLY